MNTKDIAERMLEPLVACLTPELAVQIVNARISPDVQARLDELAGMANQACFVE